MYDRKIDHDRMMKITVHENHFSSPAQAYDEIEAAGKHTMEMDVPVCDVSPYGANQLL